MASELDPTMKVLATTQPADWLPLVGLPRAPIRFVADTDQATVLSGAADAVFRVQDEPEDYLFHLDFQSGHDSSALPPRLCWYNGNIAYKHALSVLSVAVLLTRAADSPRVTGYFERRVRSAPEAVSVFRYQVLRVWEHPPEVFLNGGLGVLALAPISAVSDAELPSVVRAMETRLRKVSRRRAADVWSAAYILLGATRPKAFLETLFRGVMSMKESSTYQAILEEGRSEGRIVGARESLLLVGMDAFGEPSLAVRQRLEAIGEVDELQALTRAVLHATSWDDLLANAKPKRMRRKR